MAYDGWLVYNDIEVVNLARTVQLAELQGIDTVWIEPDAVAWIEDAVGGSNYGDITEAPWYDSRFPASAEFAGIIPLSIPALDDSTRESTVVEYVTDGGKNGKPRNATLPIVVSAAIVATTDRGAYYGKQWLDKVLAGQSTQAFCSGTDLRYMSYRMRDLDVTPPPFVHRRDVSTSRGATVTRKRSTDCSATWFVSFTWTAGDPFEYGEPVNKAIALGSGFPEPDWNDSGDVALIELGCPVYDYTPIYDPRYPALVAPPSAPSFYPDGWDIAAGDTFQRWWALVDSVAPSTLDVVPVITLRSEVEQRMIRVSVYAADADPDDQCDALFSAVVTYLPAGVDFVIDGEQQASYAWDGATPVVRRTDSLVYSPEANPVQWTSFNDPMAYYITLDLFDVDSDAPVDGEVVADFAFVSKSD